jgi:nicotinamide mononucleotide (NMN) deamidase PncC
VTYETVPVVGADGEETNDEVGTVYPDWVMTGVDHAGGAV